VIDGDGEGALTQPDKLVQQRRVGAELERKLDSVIRELEIRTVLNPA
jgi:hypothetical protein